MDRVVKNSQAARLKGKKPREPGYARLAHLLREEIFGGHVAAGARLKVSDIARRYGTSTNPAREALQVLEGEGLVTITPNRGASVREINEDMLQNVFELRTLLWIYIIKTFVEFATADEIAELRRHQLACEAAAQNGDYPAYHHANILFHDLIVDHHFNSEAVAIIRKHNGWMKAFAKSEPLSLAQMRRSVAEHWRIVEAVEAGETQKAADAIEEHLTNAQASFLERLRRRRLNAAN
ncbi:DNA-binding transcriptional regulator, GntR family [Palleronia marisminoris]|uniref:HTH-type transcriptional regulator McbR n=1 Tax=Palleronia marisminoris TaxID=315423 RepID=A0A1Y5TTJ4_9RHOB|nr:GntR family transcriptional regulator [Palleronia marisminoris]SFH49212.1 DNA-binding transcriptional regulator, GntR family [Palleronia marisminoris]SLN69877.1 HTH-type transcriptional regulator McbR [Palleronia marisminoris]